MTIIDADHERRYDIPGVPGPARKPVDIDASKTGFTDLRSLRLYRFEAGSVIDGHAEEDEVFVVVTAGRVTMKVGWDDAALHAESIHLLEAPLEAGVSRFVAYLPPHSVYQLVSETAADVVYARATPVGQGKPPAFFASIASPSGPGLEVLLEERSHAERLRLKVVHVPPQAMELAILYGARQTRATKRWHTYKALTLITLATLQAATIRL